MKKSVLSLALVLMLTLCAAFGTANAESAANKLTVWCWDPTYNINAINVAAEIYKQDHPDFEVEVVETDFGSIMQKLATAATSNKYDVLPDIILIQDTYYQLIVASYPDAFVDLTDTAFNFEEFSPGKVGFSTVANHHYGIPFDSGTAISAYRTDVLEQAGYTIDDFTGITWSEWIEKAKVVLEKTNVPLLNGLGASNQIVLMLQSAGGSFFNEDGSANIVNNDILRQVVTTYVDMVKAGVFVEETGWDTYIGGMNTGRIGGAMNGCWIMSSIEAAEDQAGLWAIADMPSLDGIGSATHASSQGGSTWAVTANCQNVDLAVDFFKTTFGGSMELYDQILSTGAISTWLPAAASEKYQEPVAYFSNQPVFAMITEYSANVPAVETGAYMNNATSYVNAAITNIIYSGGTIDSELQAAEDSLVFDMN